MTDHATIADKIDAARFILDYFDDVDMTGRFDELASDAQVSNEEYEQHYFDVCLRLFPRLDAIMSDPNAGQSHDQKIRMIAIEEIRTALRYFLGAPLEDVLSEALFAVKVIEDLQHSYVLNVRRIHECIVEKLGTHFHSIYAVKNHDLFRMYSGISNCLQFDAHAGYLIDPEKLAAVSSQYAYDVMEIAYTKIRAKLVRLDRAQVNYINGGDFLIDGYRNGDRVTLRQQVIINFSAKGTMFNQFPARIAINGRFISAAAYKKRFGL